MTVHINLTGKKWVERPGSYLKTCGTCLEPLEQLLNAKNSADVKRELAKQNGFYALVWERGEFTYAAVDHVRSIPLFYGVNQNEFYLSDDADWVRQKVGNEEMECIAKEEFLLSGYVTGSDTLYPDVKQLQAGEFLVVSSGSNDGKLKLEKDRYYRFLHTEPKSYNEVALKNQLESTIMTAMQSLIDFAAGRQLVLPLSGGYDSRLIAASLKQLGYKNVLCFTYGVPGNKEALYSQKVAATLGFDWDFVEYSADRWQSAWRTHDAMEYRNTASNHVSLPHVQDWLAIRELVSNGRIANSAIVVPGHSGDFVAGSHIPKIVFESPQHSENSLYQALIRDHLSNAPKDDMKLDDDYIVSKRLCNRIGIPFDGSDVCFANLYELWDWQERQSKYIVNSVRVYEQFGLDWWLPLWDLRFLNFWQNVPLTLRKERLWFVKWIDQYYLSVSNRNACKPIVGNATDHTRFLRFLIWISKKLPLGIQKFLKAARAASSSKKHFLAFEGLVSDGDLKDYKSEGYNLIGIYSSLYIKSRW